MNFGNVLSVGDAMHNSTGDPLDRNITSYHDSRSKANKYVEDSVQVSHLYFKDKTNPLFVSNIDEYRNMKAIYGEDIPILKCEFYTEEQKRKTYLGEEENIYCGRFPHIDYCGCKYPCPLMLEKITPVEVIDNIYCGPIEAAYKTKELTHLQIKYILNVSCVSYTKRNKYFKYLDIFINDNHTENAIKFFKITNRFIDDALRNDGKILIHSEQGRSRCWVFLMAYMIGRKHMKYIETCEAIKEKFASAEPNDNYLTQLKHYDLDVNV